MIITFIGIMLIVISLQIMLISIDIKLDKITTYLNISKKKEGKIWKDYF